MTISLYVDVQTILIFTSKVVFDHNHHVQLDMGTVSDTQLQAPT